MGVTVGFSLQQFLEILKIRDAAGQPYTPLKELGQFY